MVRADLIGVGLGEHGAAHHDRHTGRLLFQQFDGFPHGGHGRGHQRAQTHQPRARFTNGFQHAHGRHILAQIGYGKTIIEQEHLDDILADVMHVAMDSSQHHTPRALARLGGQPLTDGLKSGLQAAFEPIRQRLPAQTGEGAGRVVLATVHGDVHDIGKNIVKVLLLNYGFAVTDLGKDVPPVRVLEAVRETGARLVGLSALMTTTVPAMRETIELLKKEAPGVTVVVGGAVLTQAYADQIGADHYAPDAMATVRVAQQVLG